MNEGDKGLKFDEMQACAADTLMFFLHKMPDAPFTVNDVVFAFAKKAEMANRA